MNIIYFGISINDDLLKLGMYSCEDSNETDICKKNNIFLFLPEEKSVISFLNIINILRENEINDKIIILYDYKFWMSFKDWYQFNDKNWPSSYVNYIANSYDDLKSYMKNLRLNEDNLIDENIENYKSIYDKRSNIFLNENGIDELINEIFEEINTDEDNIFNILIDNEYESD